MPTCAPKYRTAPDHALPGQTAWKNGPDHRRHQALLMMARVGYRAQRARGANAGQNPAAALPIEFALLTRHKYCVGSAPPTRRSCDLPGWIVWSYRLSGPRYAAVKAERVIRGLDQVFFQL